MCLAFVFVFVYTGLEDISSFAASVVTVPQIALLYVFFVHLMAAWFSLLSAGIIIERLRNLGSTPDVVARRCVFEKDT